MCGIAGYIGTSKNPKISHALMTALLKATEKRGIEATGYWSASDGADGSIQYYKEPTRASWFVTKDMWKLNAEKNPNLMLAHCRQPTKTGDERINANNHPFVSADGTTALIHNGKITEYSALKDDYEIDSTCDSEILLRIFENGEYSEDLIKAFKSDKVMENLTKDFHPQILNELIGLWRVYSLVHCGSAFATAIGRWHQNNERVLWLFRNPDRPLHVIDLIEPLGQLWFCSTADIFREATEECQKELNGLIKDDQLLLEMPHNEVWLIRLNSDKNFSFKRFKMATVKSNQWLKESNTKIKKTKKIGDCPVELITAKFEEMKILSNVELQVVINQVDVEDMVDDDTISAVDKAEMKRAGIDDFSSETNPDKLKILQILQKVKDKFSTLIDADEVADESWDEIISELETAQKLSEKLSS